jgi:CHAT domain-containing protein
VIWLDELRTGAVIDQADRLFTAGRTRQSQAWLDDLVELTEWLWSSAMEHVVKAATAASAAASAEPGLTLIPCGLLALFPFHAASRQDPGTRTGRIYALDHMTISYSYSLQSRAVPSGAVPSESRLVTVASAGGPSPAALPHAGADIAAAIIGFTGEVVDLPATIAPERLLQEFSRGSDLHIACHGRADLGDPIASRLILSAGSELLVSDLLKFAATQRIPARLAVLSACDTGIVGLPLIDEVIGLPAVFKQSGVETIVASLWLVPDRATALLMYRFYQEMRSDGQAPAVALRKAQQWVRDTTNADKSRELRGCSEPRLRALRDVVRALPRQRRDQEHPVSWAGFAVIG